MEDVVAGGSEVQYIIFDGIGRKQIGQSSLGGGSLNSASSRSSAALILQSCLCFGQCFFWHSALQYLTCIHDLHVFRLTPPPASLPHSAQQTTISFITTTITNANKRPQMKKKNDYLIWRVEVPPSRVPFPAGRRT